MRAILQVFLSNVVSKSLWAAAGLALIRFMPAAEFAQLTLAVTLTTLFVSGICDNLNQLFIIEHDELQLGKRVTGFLLLQVGLLACWAIVGLPLMWWLPNLYLSACLAAVAQCAFEFVKTVFRRQLKFIWYSAAELIKTVSFVSVISVWILTSSELMAWKVLVLQATCAWAATSVVAWRSFSWPSPLVWRDALQIGQRIVSGRCLFVFLYFVVLALLLRVDTITLSWLDSESELATYGAAFRLFAVLTMILNAMHVVLMPLMQKTYSAEGIQAVLTRNRRLLLIVVPAIAFGAWLAGWALPLIDGGRYPGAVMVFRVLSVAAAIGTAFSAHVNVALRYRDYRFLFKVALVATCANVVLNFLLIPTFHAAGAAWATVVSVAMVNCVAFLRARMLLAHATLVPEQTTLTQAA